MERVIHARKDEHGKFKFKSWSIFSESYGCDEMNEEKFKEWELIMVIMEAIKKHNYEINIQIKRAKKNGTSSLDEKRDVWGNWDKEGK